MGERPFEARRGPVSMSHVEAVAKLAHRYSGRRASHFFVKEARSERPHCIYRVEKFQANGVWMVERTKDNGRLLCARPPSAETADLYNAEHGQDNQQYQDAAQAARGVVTPPGAVGPGGKRADQKYDKNDQKNDAHRKSPVATTPR